MAEFETKCTHCGVELMATDEWIGMTAECPQCKRTFEITRPESVHQVQVTSADDNKELPFIFVCQECGTQVELPGCLKGQKYECKACCEESIAEPATEKNCPYCGKVIKFHAMICKHCKKNLTGGMNNSSLLQPIAPAAASNINLHPITPIAEQRLNLQPNTSQQKQNYNQPIPNNGIALQPAQQSVRQENLIFYKQQSMLTACVLHFLFGCGHFYLGQQGKTGLLYAVFVPVIIGAMNTAAPIFGIIGWGVCIASWVDLIMLNAKLQKGLGVKKWEFFPR